MFVIVRIGVTFLCRNVCLILKKNSTNVVWGKGPTHIPLEGEGPHVFPWTVVGDAIHTYFPFRREGAHTYSLGREVSHTYFS